MDSQLTDMTTEAEAMELSGEYWLNDSIKDALFEERYDLDKELGRGATAEVFMCTSKGTTNSWAVKIIQKENCAQKFIDTEIGILLRIRHENIIRLKEIYETYKKIYLVLELVTGGELFDRIVTRGFYSEKDAAICIKHMLLAVKHLHDNDIVHRDLKPENLLYENTSDDSVLKIADFGLSKIMDGQVHTNTVCGTPGYCAPEVLRGTKYDSAIDLWSIGVILYILLCGYEPFFAEDDIQMFKKIMKGEYVFDESHWSEISHNAKDLINKLLQVDPKKRLTAGKALNHPWVRGAAKGEHMERTQDNLKQFNASRKLKAATHVVLACTIGRLGRMNPTPVNIETQIMETQSC